VTGLEAGVPEAADQGLQLAAQLCIRFARQEHEEINIGMRKKFAAAVSAHGGERERGGQGSLAP
jgi:hypothetical protein